MSRLPAAAWPLTIDPIVQQAKLVGPVGAAGDKFGDSVAISGDTALIACYPTSSRLNPVYVFIRTDGRWALESTLRSPTGMVDDDFGASVALSGDTAIVGADKADTLRVADAGAAYVFVRAPREGWQFQAALVASDLATNDVLGQSVALSGDTAVVGAVGADGGHLNQGAAYVFVRRGTTWTQQQKLVAGDGAAFDGFGNSVALSGDTALVGAASADVEGREDQGDGVRVRPERNDLDPAAEAGREGRSGVGLVRRFGGAVRRHCARRCLGCLHRKPRPCRTVYVFVRSGTTWTQQQKLVATDRAATTGSAIRWRYPAALRLSVPLLPTSRAAAASVLHTCSS